ncbi:MAG: VTT domain-containing protein [Candidatus Diapherotrites archaeon]
MFFDSALSFFQSLVGQYGLLGVFLAALACNATIFIPIPFEILLFALAASGQFFLPALVLASAFGAALGEISSYLVGWGGKSLMEKTGAKHVKQWHDAVKKVESKGMAAIVLLAFIPFLPFDLVALAAGYVRFNFSKYFVASLIGKIARYSLVALAGFYGVQIVQQLWAAL